MNSKMLGDAIKRLRAKNRLSQSELAELTGVNIFRVKKWEAYEESPHITLLPLLIQLLEKTASEEGSDLFLYYYDFVIGEERA